MVDKIRLIYKSYYGEKWQKRKIQKLKNSRINPYTSLMKYIIGNVFSIKDCIFINFSP